MVRTKERAFTQDTVTLFFEGCFYEVYGNDALVVGDIFGYRVKEMRDQTPTCGFPQSGLDSVLAVLEEKHVSYITMKDNEVIREHDFGEENAYPSYGKNVTVETYVSPKQKAAGPSSAENGSARTAIQRPAEAVDFILPDLMQPLMDHGKALRLYVRGTEAEISFVDGYILRINASV